jgi:hypothetical protein
MKKNEKPESTFPIEPDSTTALVPRSKDEKRFYDKHVIAKKADANGNGDDVFNASKIKAYDRSASNHGYNTGQDQAVYESRTLTQILGERKMTPAEIKKRSEIADAIAKKNPGYSKAKKFRIATAAAMKEETELSESEIADGQYTKHFNNAKKILDDIANAMDMHSYHVSNGEKTAQWHHVEMIKNLHNQLSNIHDDVLRHVDYSKPLEMQKESIDNLLNIFDPATSQMIQAIYESVKQEEKDLIEELILSEDYDGLQNLLNEMGQE